MFGLFGSSTTQDSPKSQHSTTPPLSISAHFKDTLPASTRDTVSEGDALRRNASLLSLATPSPTRKLPLVFAVDESGSQHVHLYVSPDLGAATSASSSPSSTTPAKSKLDPSYSHFSHPDAPELTSLPSLPSHTSRSLDTVINHNYVSTTDTNASELQFLAKKSNKPPTAHPRDSSPTLVPPTSPHRHQHSPASAVAPETDPYLLAVCEQGLLEQYARLANTCPSGVYVLPDAADSWVWHGVIFVHSAFYSQGIFRFVIDIPKSYPADLPVLRFTSEIAHPMVSSTGYLDLRLWNPETPYIVLLLSYLKKCMYKPQLWDEVESLGSVNPEFSKLRSKNPEKFLMECRQIAERSVLRVYKKNDHYISGNDSTIPKTQSIPKSLPLSSFLSTSSSTSPSLSSSSLNSVNTPLNLPARRYNPSPIVFRHFSDDANTVLQQLLAMGRERSVCDGTHATAEHTGRLSSLDHHGVEDDVGVGASRHRGGEGATGDPASAEAPPAGGADCARLNDDTGHGAVSDGAGAGDGDGGDRSAEEAECEHVCEGEQEGDRVGQYLALFAPQ